MRKKLLVVLLLGLAVVSVMKAQEHNSAITTNIFNLFIALPSAEFETKIADNMGLFGSLRFGSYEIGDFKTSIFGVSAGVDIYPGKSEGIEGFYIGPMLYLNQMTVTFKSIGYYDYTDIWNPVYVPGKTEDVSGSMLGPMCRIGYRWDWGGFAFSPSAQLGFIVGKIESSITDAAGQKMELKYGGFSFGLGLNMGVAF
ncbi:MAG: DUF3575 domain-containing protein [Elusimicrobiota bacterium]